MRSPNQMWAEMKALDKLLNKVTDPDERAVYLKRVEEVRAELHAWVLDQPVHLQLLLLTVEFAVGIFVLPLRGWNWVQRILKNLWASRKS